MKKISLLSFLTLYSSNTYATGIGMPDLSGFYILFFIVTILISTILNQKIVSYTDNKKNWLVFPFILTFVVGLFLAAGSILFL